MRFSVLSPAAAPARSSPHRNKPPPERSLSSSSCLSPVKTEEQLSVLKSWQQSSFSVIHKVANAGIFVFVKIENILDTGISHFEFNSKCHDKHEFKIDSALNTFLFISIQSCAEMRTLPTMCFTRKLEITFFSNPFLLVIAKNSITVRSSSCVKVMFWQVSINLFTGGIYGVRSLPGPWSHVLSRGRVACYFQKG